MFGIDPSFAGSFPDLDFIENSSTGAIIITVTILFVFYLAAYFLIGFTSGWVAGKICPSKNSKHAALPTMISIIVLIVIEQIVSYMLDIGNKGLFYYLFNALALYYCFKTCKIVCSEEEEISTY